MSRIPGISSCTHNPQARPDRTRSSPDYNPTPLYLSHARAFQKRESEKKNSARGEKEMMMGDETGYRFPLPRDGANVEEEEVESRNKKVYDN